MWWRLIRPIVIPALWVSLSICLVHAPAHAQDAASKPAIQNADGPPLLVLVMQRPEGEPVHKVDANLTLQTTLRAALRDSGKFSLFSYSPNHPTIKRALLEHVLSPNELTEPMAEIGLSHLGEALGAKYVLSFAAHEDREGMKTDVSLLQSVGVGKWRTLLSEQIHVPAAKTTQAPMRLPGVTRIVTAASRRRRLKLNEMAEVTVAAIATRIGAPYNVPAELQPMDETGATQTAKRADDRLLKSPRAKPPAKAAAVPVDDSANSPKSSSARTSAPPDTEPTIAPTPPTSASPIAKRPARTPADEPAPFVDAPAPLRAGSLTPPSPPVDNEALASQFRQKGDMANVITALRHAINERPTDVSLRRQLVQAYLDRRMPEIALDEASRALVIAPRDGALHKLAGDVQLALGDTAAARRQYGTAGELNPKDAANQVALGDSQLADNNFTEAMKTYEAAAVDDPKSPLPHRRMAKALITAASADSNRYAAALDQIRKARALTPPADADVYMEDYVTIVRIVQGRVTDLLDELQATYLAQRNGQRAIAEIKQGVVDLRARGDALAAFLDKLPPAPGMDITQAGFQQATAYLLQAISGFRGYLTGTDPSSEDAMNGARTNALRELDVASKRLPSPRGPERQ